MTSLLNRALSRRRRAANDDGIALLLALIFVMTIGLVTAALLPYTSTGLRTAATVKDVRSIQNAVDGAVDQAINSIRGSFARGSKPLCSNGVSTTPYRAPVYQPNDPAGSTPTYVQVDFCNDKDNYPSNSFPTDEQPPFAIQTLHGPVTMYGNNSLVVAGGILSNSDVTFIQQGGGGTGAQASLNVDGDVYAKGVCSARNLFVVSGDEHCSNTSPAYSASDDPDPTVDPFGPVAQGGDGLQDPFTTFTTDATKVDPLGTCTNSTSVVTFVPGYYTQSPRPDPVSCPSGGGTSHTVWWFQPGQYYFDFPDSRFASAGFTDADSWFAANNLLIIGGTPSKFWDPATTSSSDVFALYKNNPDHSTPGCDDTKPGVTFAFGGPTRLGIHTGSNNSPDDVELCAGPVGTQQISLFGVRAGTIRSTTPVNPQPASIPTSSKTGLVDNYAPVAAAAKVDGVPAVAQLSGASSGLKKASLTWSTFTDSTNAPLSIPAGSIIVSAQLKATWTTTGTTSRVSNTLQYSYGSPATTVTLASTTNGSGTYDLPLSQAYPAWRMLQNPTIKFTADGSALRAGTGQNPVPDTATSSVDGVELLVQYIPPAIEPVRCAGDTDALPACNILTNTIDDTVFLHGTVYAPASILEAAIHNYSSTVFERGVVVDTLIGHLSSSAKQTLPPFQLPHGTTQRVVRFTAWLTDQNGNKIESRPRLIAVVRYIDFTKLPGGKTLAAAGHSIKVLEWAVMR